MARKFSLKDNPIFQRLEIPKPRNVEAGFSTSSTVEADDSDGQGEVTPSSKKGQGDVKFRPSNLDPQNLTVEAPSISTQENEADFLSSVRQVDKEKVGATSVKNQKELTSQDSKIERLPPDSEAQNLTLKKKPSEDELHDKTIEEDATQTLAPADPNSEDQVTHSRKNVSSSRYEDNVSQQSDISRKGNLPSKFDPQNLILKKETADGSNSTEKQEGHLDSDGAVVSDPKHPNFTDLREAFEKSLFFSFYNEMNDELLPLLDAAEQILYSRLFRLSYGFNRNYCTVSQPVLKDKTGLSRNTIRTGLQSLVQKEWIRIVDAGNHVSTTYRIVLPRERKNNLDRQKMTLKNRGTKFEGQNLSRKIRRSETDVAEDQKLEVQNLTGKEKGKNLSNKNKILNDGGLNFEPQKSGTLTVTNNTLTLSPRELGNLSQENYKLTTAAGRLVTLFYSQLGQQPSSAKQSKSVLECLQLFDDGFSEEQVEYGINWLLARHPGTGAFSRVAHFIDQALKEKQTEQRSVSEQEKKRRIEEQELNAQQRLIEQEKKLEKIKAGLNPEELKVLHEKASQIIEVEHGGVKFGRETLIQIKLNELIREQYLKEMGDDS